MLTCRARFSHFGKPILLLLEQIRKWSTHCNRTCRRVETRLKPKKNALNAALKRRTTLYPTVTAIVKQGLANKSSLRWP